MPHKTFLSHRGYGLLKSAFDAATLEGIRTELTVSPKTVPGFDMNVPSFPLYLESPSKLYIPKYYGLQKFGRPDVMKIHPGEDIHIDFKGNLRPEQMEPVNSYLQICKQEEKRGGLLMLPCGMGKTVMAIYLCSQLKKKTMVIVHKSFLMKQWKERIQQYAPHARIGTIQGKTLDIEGKDIVIAMLQSLSMKDYPDETFRSFGMVIIDEVHHCAAEVFSQALHKVNFQYALGLSASVRKDGLTKVYKWFLGEVIYSVKRKADGTVKVLLKDYYCTHPSYSTEHKLFNGNLNFSKMINAICGWEPRTQVIVDTIIQLRKDTPERKILILSDRLNHLHVIKEKCMATAESREVVGSMGFYIGGMSERELQASEACDVILGSYHMASEGMDIPTLNTLIFASPKSDVMQSVGRILRQKEHERVCEPLVIDIVDSFSVFKSQGRRRKQFYEKYGYKVEAEADIRFSEAIFKRFQDEGLGCLITNDEDDE